MTRDLSWPSSAANAADASAWPAATDRPTGLPLGWATPFILNVAAINASAATIAFFSSLKHASADVGPWRDVPTPLAEANRIEAAVVAAALPLPVVGPINSAGAWMGKAAGVVRDFRRRATPAQTPGLHPRCAAFFTLMATEALIAGSVGAACCPCDALAPQVERALAMLSRVELIVLADNLAGECSALPEDAPLAWWNEKIAVARNDVRADPNVASMASILLVAATV